MPCRPGLTQRTRSYSVLERNLAKESSINLKLVDFERKMGFFGDKLEVLLPDTFTPLLCVFFSTEHAQGKSRLGSHNQFVEGCFVYRTPGVT